ncbi:MAG: glycosyltransferase family 4 protein [Planctomycetota bacterium]
MDGPEGRTPAESLAEGIGTDASGTDARPAAPPHPRTLGIVAEMFISRCGGDLYIHFSWGRVIDRLAARYERVLLCAPTLDGPPQHARDYRIRATNLELIPAPYYSSMIQSLPHMLGIIRAYARICRRADRLFVRGLMPYVAALYTFSYWHGLSPCHWVIGNSLELVKDRRCSLLKRAGYLLYGWQDRLAMRLGRRLTCGAFLCNGTELAAAYASPRTTATVSSSITDEEFYERADTCQGPVVRILFVGFPRPEKGLRYLLEAFALLKLDRPVELVIVGAWELFPAHRAELDALGQELGVTDRVRWHGYAEVDEMYRQMRAADLLVLPTLSEGTPHVLVEARANSLPIVATRVGGIPTSVTDGEDGLLVPSKDAAALARAIERVVQDGELRRRLIRNGYESARRLTVDRFAELLHRTLECG